MTDMHHPLSPSSYPAWNICPQWQGKGANANTETGTTAHALLYKAFTQEIDINDDLATADVDRDILWRVRSAFRGISDLVRQCLMDNEPELTYFEETVKGEFFFSQPFGTADMIAIRGTTLIVVDYKDRYSDRDYTSQLAAYAAFSKTSGLYRLQPKRVCLITWYGDTATYTLTEKTMDECVAMTEDVIQRRAYADTYPRTASPWCNLCEHCGQCPSALRLVEKTTELLPAEKPTCNVIPYTSIAPMLAVVSEVKKRIKAFEDFAKQVASEQGGLTDEEGNLMYALKEKSRSEINLTRLFQAVKDILPADELLAIVSVTKAKVTEALVGKGMNKKDIAALLAEVSDPLPPTIELAKVKK